MWRYSYENWERRKSYLIRSLFQDIPLLSPVPEANESSISPSEVYPARRLSPLPPLIIERQPNRHDYPKEYYDELEKKMRKVYKKLFFNIESRSVDDLINLYDTSYENFSTSTRNLDKDYEANEALEYATFDRNEQFFPASQILDWDSPSNDPSEYSVDNPGDKDISSSQLSIFAPNNESQVVTDIIIHRTSSKANDKVNTINRSVNEDTESTHSEIMVASIDDINDDSKSENDTGSESRKLLDSQDTSLTSIEFSQEKVFNNNTEANISNLDTETMRRQENISQSFGSFGFQRDSQQNESKEQSPINNYNTPHPNIDIDIDLDFARDLDDRSQRSIESLSRLETTFVHDSFANLYNNSPKDGLREPYKRVSNVTVESNLSPLKKQRYESIGVQAVSTHESHHTTKSQGAVRWNLLKNNFFVGIPKVFKFCSCNDHVCLNEL